MRAADWPIEPVVIERLLNEPQRFELSQAVSLLTAWLQRLGVPQDRAVVDYLRFNNSTSLSFPPSEVEAIAVSADTDVKHAADLLAAIENQQLEHIAVTPASTGYLGSSGFLPNHYTEEIARHEREGARAFLDILATRTVTLLQEACTKYRVERMQEADGGDEFLARLLALGGVHEVDGRKAETSALDKEALAFYAGVLQRRTISSDTLAELLTEYFGVPFSVSPFERSYEAYATSEQTALGVQNCTLGGGAMLGGGRWVRNKHAEIRIGPLKRTDFARFTPGHEGERALRQMADMFCLAPIQFSVELELNNKDIVPLILCDQPGQLGLGLDTYLGTRNEQRPPDYKYEIERKNYSSGHRTAR